MRRTTVFKMLLAMLLTTTGILAQEEGFTEEEVSFQSRVFIQKLVCLVHPGGIWDGVSLEDRWETQLSNHFDNNLIIMNLDEYAEISSYSSAHSPGCDIEALDQLMEAVLQTYGVIDATITVHKKTAKEPKIFFDSCRRSYYEKLSIDFGNGIVLQTHEGRNT